MDQNSRAGIHNINGALYFILTEYSYGTFFGLISLPSLCKGDLEKEICSAPELRADGLPADSA